jgi:hypothetical protein
MNLDAKPGRECVVGVEELIVVEPEAEQLAIACVVHHLVGVRRSADRRPEKYAQSSANGSSHESLQRRNHFVGVRVARARVEPLGSNPKSDIAYRAFAVQLNGMTFSSGRQTHERLPSTDVVSESGSVTTSVLPSHRPIE